MYVVGLTGGIGSGKSAVAAAFVDLGIDVTDTDRLAHALTGPGTPGLEALVAAFGSSILQSDGTLDRAALRRMAFAD
jgi:dephospho-CoA kinase